jgi:hypothetical protein
MFHSQDCCESVSIESIVGDLHDLVGKPIVKAEVSSNVDDESVDDESVTLSATWTFYEIATVKGNVTIRWYGESNGCYSETAELYEVTETCRKTNEEEKCWGCDCL